MDQCTLSNLKLEDFDEIVASFQKLGWHKPRSQYERYLSEQISGVRSVIVCRCEGKFAGYVTVIWSPVYGGFKAMNIPEICDLNVLPHMRRMGLGTRLIEECETLAVSKGISRIGLGVGLIADYGNAQRLYFKLGYMPDGNGLHHGAKLIEYGETVRADDDLVIYLSKSL